MTKMTDKAAAAIEQSKVAAAEIAIKHADKTAQELEFYAKFDSLLANDLKAHKKVMGATGTEWDAFKQILLNCEPFLVSKESLKVLTSRITAEYAAINSVEAARIRNTCLSNARRVAFGGSKGKDSPIVQGLGFAKLVEVIESVTSGGIKAFRVAVSEAVPAELKDGRKDAQKPTGGTQNQTEAHSSKDAKKHGEVETVSRAQYLDMMQKVLSDSIKFLLPGSESKVILEIQKLQTMLDDIMLQELETEQESESIEDVKQLVA